MFHMSNLMTESKFILQSFILVIFLQVKNSPFVLVSAFLRLVAKLDIGSFISRVWGKVSELIDLNIAQRKS